MEPERRSFTRRQFLARNAWACGLLLAAACAPAGSEQPAASKTGPQPTSPPAGAAPPPTSVPAAAAPASQGAPAVAGVFNVWFSANWNEVTDKAVGETFVEWGKTKNIKVEWQSIPASPQQLAKESAAMAAGQPPELNSANRTYWYSQGEMADLKDLVSKFKDQAGGMYDIAITSNTVADGALIGAPYAVDVWPAHWRMDIIGPATGGRFFESYDEMLQLGSKIQQPPRNFMYAMALGHEGDHVNNMVSLLWAYGGRIANEQGVPDMINPANKAGIDMAVQLWKARLIPPDTFAQTVTSWNNETYQKSRGLIAVNPCTIMGWLLVNDTELGDKTGLSLLPKGSAGSFAEGTSIAFNYYKKAALAAEAPSALEFFMRPDNVERISKSVEGRFVPVYRDHAKTEFWTTSKFAELKKIAEFGRIREYPAAPVAWLPDVTDSRFVMSDMMSKVVNENMAIEDAQAWAQEQMMDSYNKITKRA